VVSEDSQAVAETAILRGKKMLGDLRLRGGNSILSGGKKDWRRED
jgi:hypothetical protein